MAFRTWRARLEIQQMVPGMGYTKRTWKVASDGFICWPLTCVGVEELIGSDVSTIRGTSGKASQEFGQYSSS